MRLKSCFMAIFLALLISEIAPFSGKIIQSRHDLLFLETRRGGFNFRRSALCYLLGITFSVEACQGISVGAALLPEAVNYKRNLNSLPALQIGLTGWRFSKLLQHPKG